MTPPTPKNNSRKLFSYDKGGYRDCQFQVWKTGRPETRKKSNEMQESIFQVQPDNLSGLFLRDITFPTTPRKKRSLHLSLKQTQILATLLPDAIINISDLSSDRVDTFVGALMFADVSGFTALCEKYNGFGKSGSDKLTATLNRYLGAMVEVIYKYGGDVLKFSGDAILALWKLGKNEYIYSLIHKVISCALYIQNSIGVYETEVKVLLKVKLAISAGNMMFSVIGDDNSRHYLVVGSPVYEVKSAEKVCTSGEVVLSFSAWGHLSPINYEHYWKDSEHVKIIRIIYNPENTKREILQSVVKGNVNLNEGNYPYLKSKETYRKRWGISSSFSEVRVLIHEAVKRNLSSELRTFLIPSVIQQIDADLPMEYLSEMRNVTVMFVNIIPNRLYTKRLINMVDKAYIIICSLAYKAMGSVNKVSLFDKDVMVLIIFGLRGFNHEGEVAGSLKCGYDIRQACSALDGVFSVSVGVTTGQAYCGVVGHPLRREYTVIGAIVNKAARIMCAYPGKVTCDQDTFLFSNLAASLFTVQEKKHLKGIEDTGPIYEFTLEKRKANLAALKEGLYPILGREREMYIFRRILTAIKNNMPHEKAYLIIGAARTGKTRLLDEMIIEAHGCGFTPITIALQNVHSTLPYGAARYIIKQALGIPDSANVFEKETKLSSLLKDRVPSNQFWYLNEVMSVNFPEFEPDEANDRTEKFVKIEKLFHILMDTGTESTILTIDDVDSCDELSWRLVLSIIKRGTKFVVMTMPKRLRPETYHLFKFPPGVEEDIIKVVLSGVSNEHLATLACQILDAKAIPPELENTLISKSNGNPGWCESFLLSLTQSNVLKIEALPLWQVRNLGFVIPPEKDLKRSQHKTSHDEDEEDMRHMEEHPILNVESGDTVSKVRIMDLRKTGRWKIGHFLKRREYFDTSTHQFPNIHNVEVDQAYEDLLQRIRIERAQAKSFKLRDSDSSPESEDEVRGSLSTEKDEDEENEEDTEAATRTKKKIGEGMKRGRKSGEVDPETLKVSDVSQVEVKKGGSSKEGATFDPSADESAYFISKSKTMEFYRRMSASRFPSLLGATQSFFKSRSEESVSDDDAAETLGSKDAPQPDPKDESQTSADKESEFRPSALWKSYTDDLIKESVRRFLEKKTRVEAGKASGSGGPESSDSFVRGTSPATEAKGESTTPQKDKKRAKFDVEEEDEKKRTSPSTFTLKQESKHLQKMQSFQADSKIFPADEASRKDEEEEPEDEASEATSEGSNMSSTTNLSQFSIIKNQERKKSFMLKLFGMKTSGSDSSEAEDNQEKMEGPDFVTVPTILVNPTVKLDEIATTPECFASIIMSAFDSLKPYDQLMLKCGSVIGEKFTRKMLNAIMHDPNPVLTAEAVKRLFELHILCCGSDHVEKSAVDICRCVCTLTVNDIVDDLLPKYSFCRVPQFRYAMFRSTLYELMPLDQKRELHIRAVEFLENEEIICKFCEALPKFQRKISKAVGSSLEHFQHEGGSEKGSHTNIRYNVQYSSPELVAKRRGKKHDTRRTEFPLVMLPSLMTDLYQCECLSLQADVLHQLIRHCVAAGLKIKEMEFVIDYCSIMTTLGDYAESNTRLSEVETFLKSKNNRILNNKDKRFFLGRIYLILGQVNLERGALKKAYYYLLNTLRYFGSSFVPWRPFRIFQFWTEYLNQMANRPYSHILYGSVKSNRADDGTAICLSLLSNVFMLQNKWELAKLVALQSVNILQRSRINTVELCNAYSNAIDVYRHFGDFTLCRRLELDAAKTCLEVANYRTVGLIAAGRLNCSVLNARLISGSLHAAGRLGEAAVLISRRMSLKQLEAYIIAKVTIALMFIGKVYKASKLISRLDLKDVWYYTLCLDFILETGYMIEDSTLCLTTIETNVKSGALEDPVIYKRAVSTVYVWKSRLGTTEEAKAWYEIFASQIRIPLSGDTASNMIVILKILEGNLLVLAGGDREEIKYDLPIKQFLKAIKKASETCRLMLPRLLHLQAYYYYLMGNMTKAMNVLGKAVAEAKLQGNALERCWISHSMKVWTKTNDFDTTLWVQRVNYGLLKKWDSEEHEAVDWRNHLYSLA